MNDNSVFLKEVMKLVIKRRRKKAKAVKDNCRKIRLTKSGTPTGR